jgi:hypothetical protein
MVVSGAGALEEALTSSVRLGCAWLGFCDEGCEIGCAPRFAGECVSESAKHEIGKRTHREVGKVYAGDRIGL